MRAPGGNGQFKDEVILGIWQDGPPKEMDSMIPGLAAQSLKHDVYAGVIHFKHRDIPLQNVFIVWRNSGTDR